MELLIGLRIVVSGGPFHLNIIKTVDECMQLREIPIFRSLV